MSLSVNKKNGVKLKSSKQRGGVVLVTLIIIESVFSFFLYLSLAGKIFAPPPAQSALGVPEQISYQGRLTDTSGNPLGGTGTPYCFRYSIYDDPNAGSRIWPSGTPATSTITVADGVFSDQVGKTGGDDLSLLNFMSTSTLYLNVEVNTVTSTCTGTWSNLLPRQQITSAGFAQTAQNIYGNAIRTNVANKVQIGTGAGQATSSITLLSLDVANVMETVGSSCTNNGTLWYNSSSTRAYICEAGLIQAISNASTTIAGIQAGGASAITSGVVSISNVANIGITQNGNVISLSAPAGGGGAILSEFTPITASALITNATLGQNSIYFEPFTLQQNVYALRLNLFGSIATTISASNSTGSGGQTISAAIYARDNANTNRITSFWSGSAYLRYSFSSNSNISITHPIGISNSTAISTSQYGSNATNASTYIATRIGGYRAFPIPISSSFTPGQYWMAIARSGTSANAHNISISWAQQSISNNLAYIPFGTNSSASNAGLWSPLQGAGTYSTTSGAFPASVTLNTDVRPTLSLTLPFFNLSGWTTATSIL